jgi:DNA invertase Pin-like site-specific DNA recombinase
MSNVEASGKVTAGHLARTAYLYVRQSTLRQVVHNTESTARQYALRQRAVALGWPAEQIVTIDCDQGQSGASTADREGCQRLVAEVGIGRAGIVLGLEVSRLARNNADWHRLLELCSLSNTLILDEDGLYDPGNFNDRLLLGLKGTMSEAELHFIRARLRGGQLSKARRGELKLPLPVGLVYDPADQVVLDPDTGVQQAVRLLFDTFAATGSARMVVKTFAEQQLQFPLRVRTGAHKGELAWMPLKHWRVLSVLHNPRYAGAFCYGRRREITTPDGRRSLESLPREQWTALIHDAHSGYITWESFEHNQTALAANAQAHGTERTAGPAREGSALLQGLAVCGRCGRRMTVGYHTRRSTVHPYYQCVTASIQDGTSRCQGVPGTGVDAAITTLVLDTLTPLTLEVALNVQAELAERAEEADQLRASHVERARHRAENARRRYLSVDPDNRLVADSLEADWNDALRQLRDAQDAYDRATAADHALDEQKQADIRTLAVDFPRLWADPATPQRERKRMIRLIIDDVTLDKTDVINLNVRFRGGQSASLTVPIPPMAWQTRQTDPDTIAALDRLLDDHTDAETAAALNATGHRSGEGREFTPGIVANLRRAHGLPSRHDRLRTAGMLTGDELAAQLDVHPVTVKKWVRAGLLDSHKANDKNQRLYPPPGPHPPRKKQGSSLSRRAATTERSPTAPGGAV